MGLFTFQSYQALTLPFIPFWLSIVFSVAYALGTFALVAPTSQSDKSQGEGKISPTQALLAITAAVLAYFLCNMPVFMHCAQFISAIGITHIALGTATCVAIIALTDYSYYMVYTKTVCNL